MHKSEVSGPGQVASIMTLLHAGCSVTGCRCKPCSGGLGLCVLFEFPLLERCFRQTAVEVLGLPDWVEKQVSCLKSQVGVSTGGGFSALSTTRFGDLQYNLFSISFLHCRYLCVYTQIYIDTHICVYVYIHVHTCTYMYVYIYIYYIYMEMYISGEICNWALSSRQLVGW